MAIYFNNEMLRPKKDGNELEKRYYNEGLELDKMYEEKGGEITLKRKVEYQWDKDHSSFKPVVPYALPSEFPLYLDELGAVSVRYSEYAPVRGDKKLTWPTTKLFIEERLTLPKNKKDLAWYLIFVTNFVKSEKHPNAMLSIDDPLQEVKEQASKAKRILSIDRMLLDEESVLYAEEPLQKIAARFDIDIKGMKLDIASYVIYDAIKKGEEAKSPDVNIEVFMEFANMLASKMKKKEQGKTTEKVEHPKNVNDETEDTEEVVITPEYLDSLDNIALNELSSKLGTQKPPQVTKVEQKAQILEKVMVKQ